MTLKEIYQALAAGESIQFKVIDRLPKTWYDFKEQYHVISLYNMEWRIKPSRKTKVISYPEPLKENAKIDGECFEVRMLIVPYASDVSNLPKQAFQEGRMFESYQDAKAFVEAVCS